MSNLYLNPYEQDLETDITQALANDDLPTLALLMNQRAHLPLLTAARRVRGAHEAKQTLHDRIVQVGELGLKWQAKQHVLQLEIQSRGDNYMRSEAWKHADIVVRSLSQTHGMLAEKQNYINKVLHDAEPNMQAAIQGVPVIMPPDVVPDAEALWARFVEELRAYGVELDTPENEKVAA